MSEFPPVPAAVAQLRAHGSRMGVPLADVPDVDAAAAAVTFLLLAGPADSATFASVSSAGPVPRRLLARAVLRACGRPQPDGPPPSSTDVWDSPTPAQVTALLAGFDPPAGALQVSASDWESVGDWDAWRVGQMLRAEADRQTPSCSRRVTSPRR